MVTEGSRLADVGTDHGYIPIYLCSRNKIPSAIAMDINKGPLMRAKEHIRAYGMQDRIETRLSDGVEALQPGEADSVVIAGMGGGLVQKILREGEAVLSRIGELILQPQSELGDVRKFLYENGYQITGEKMVFEDGKFYPMLRAVPGSMPCLSDIEWEYGPFLLEESHPVLAAYLVKEEQILQGVLENLSAVCTEKGEARRREIMRRLAENQRAKERMK